MRIIEYRGRPGHRVHWYRWGVRFELRTHPMTMIHRCACDRMGWFQLVDRERHEPMVGYFCGPHGLRKLRALVAATERATAPSALNMGA